MHDGGDHWFLVCAGFLDGVDIAVFDSNFADSDNMLANRVMGSIASLANSKSETITVSVQSCQQQHNGTACGIYAIAYAVELLFGRNPSFTTFNTSKMRSHLKECLKNKEFTPIPATYSRSVSVRRIDDGIRSNTVPIYCSCRRTERVSNDEPPPVEEKMAECDGCGLWYHRECQQIPAKVFKSKEKGREVE